MFHWRLWYIDNSIINIRLPFDCRIELMNIKKYIKWIILKEICRILKLVTFARGLNVCHNRQTEEKHTYTLLTSIKWTMATSSIRNRIASHFVVPYEWRIERRITNYAHINIVVRQRPKILSTKLKLNHLFTICIRYLNPTPVELNKYELFTISVLATRILAHHSSMHNSELIEQKCPNCSVCVKRKIRWHWQTDVDFARTKFLSNYIITLCLWNVSIIL